MNSASLPTASSPLPIDDVEVESRKGQNQEEVVLEAPQDDLPDSRPEGGKATEGSKSGPGPDTAPEPSVVLEPDRRSLHKKVKSARRRLPSTQRRRTICWRRLTAPPSTKNTALL